MWHLNNNYRGKGQVAAGQSLEVGRGVADKTVAGCQKL